MADKRKKIIYAFSQNLFLQRREKGLSFRDLYLLTGIDKADLQKMERGKINVTIITVEKIADGLEIDPRELLKPFEPTL